MGFVVCVGGLDALADGCSTVDRFIGLTYGLRTGFGPSLVADADDHGMRALVARVSSLSKLAFPDVAGFGMGKPSPKVWNLNEDKPKTSSRMCPASSARSRHEPSTRGTPWLSHWSPV